MPIKANLTWSPPRWLSVLSVLVPMAVGYVAATLFGLTWQMLLMQVLSFFAPLPVIMIGARRASHYRRLASRLIEAPLEKALADANPDLVKIVAGGNDATAQG